MGIVRHGAISLFCGGLSTISTDGSAAATAAVETTRCGAAEAAMDAGESKAEGTTKATKALEHAAAGVGTDSRCIHLLEALQSKPFPDGVVASERELYLREDVFQELFKMDRETWLQLPTWKRSNAKKKLQLF